MEISHFLFNFSEEVSQLSEEKKQELWIFLNLNDCVQGCYISNQSPNINIDKFFQLSVGEREKERDTVSKAVSEGTKM